MIPALVLILFAQAPPKTWAHPGGASPYVINIQGDPSGTPIPISGTVNSAGAADTVGSNATFDSNSDCASVAVAGQTGAGFYLAAGTLAATLAPSVSVDSTNGTNGTWVATSFVDIDGNTASTLVVTNPNAATARGLKLMAGTRYVKVCTTSFTSGSTTGNLVATTAEPPPPAAGADVTDRAARLLGVLSTGSNVIGGVTQSGTWNVNNVSGTVSLPTGAATAAKQPALGTAGTPSADVLTVQGRASMTPLLVDGSGATQPVSGTVAVSNTAEANAMAVRCVTADGTTFESCAGAGGGSGATQYAEDTASSAGEQVNMMGAVRNDTRGALVGADGDRTELQTNASGDLRVDGSAVTQPVSAASLPLPTGAATAAKQPALGTAGSASADVITVQGVASMTALKVDGSAVTQPVSISGNQAVNLAQLAGTTTDTNSGTKSAGTLRVVLATDQPALTNKLLVTPDSVALPANQSVNVSQINGVTPLMGNGATGTGSQRVTIASDNTAFSVKPGDGTNTVTVKAASTAASASDTSLVVAQSPTANTLCTGVIAISQTSSTDLKTATGKLNICSIILVAPDAEVISLVEGTGSTCGTGTAALIGSTTAANGVSLAANGGFSAVSDRAWLKMQTTSDHLCLLQSGTGRVAGVITYADQ